MVGGLIFMIAWFVLLAIGSVYSIYKTNNPSRYDVFIATVLAPLIAMIAYIYLRSMI